MSDDRIERAMRSALADGVFPGAVLTVSLRGRLAYARAFGVAASSPDDEPTTVDTAYDLASLTKPLATATAVLCLVQEGRIHLEDRVERHVPELSGHPVAEASVWHLLSHSSGLPDWRPLYEMILSSGGAPGSLRPEAANRMAVDLIAAEPLLAAPGQQSLYSDLGFIVLGWMVERVSGVCLAEFCRDRLYRPLRVTDLGFLGEAAGAVAVRLAPQRIAPTEHVAWRGRLLRGEVHDDNAYILGGVAGHAGLFGSAAAVLRVADMWLQSCMGEGSWLDPALARRFTSRSCTPGSHWALGWDTPSLPSSSGRHLSPRAFGHLGFTGTSLWIDPTVQLQVILLSNRVHLGRDNKKIQQFRPLIHDVVYEELVSGGGKAVSEA